MIRGFVASRAGMAWEQTRSDVISNNVANINTGGFRRSVAVGGEFGQMLLRRLGDNWPEGQEPPLIGKLGHGAAVAEIAVDQKSAKPLIQTDNPLDVAIIGAGEFTFQGPNGPGYTRSGAFRRDAAGQLVTAEGYPVLVNGAPVGAGAATLQIQPDGGVVVDGSLAGALDLRGADAPRVKTGVLEGSNVDLAQEMTDLITALRSYQINQRAMQMQDQTLSKAVSELGNI